MAEEIRKVIHIDTSRSATSVKDLRDEIKSLRDALVQLDSTSEQYVQIAQQVAQREQKLAQVMSASKNVLTPYQRSLNALTATYSNQRQELRALRTALENLDPATAEYRSAFERAAEITHDLQERQEMLRRSSSDLGVQLGNMRDIGTGLAAGWSSVNALMTLTGNNSEDLQKAMVKLQAGIALVQGMKGLEGLKNAVKGFINGAAKWFDKIVGINKENKTMSKETAEATAEIEKSAAASNVDAAAKTKEAGAANAVGTGMKAAAAGVKAFAKATVVLAVITTAIDLLSKAVKKLAEYFNSAFKAGEERAKNFAEIEAKSWGNIDKIHEREIARLEAEGASQRQINDENLRYHKELLQKYDDEYVALLQIQNIDLPDKKIKKKDRISNIMGFPEAIGNVEKLEERMKWMYDNVTPNMQKWSDEHVNAYVKIRENGIKTWRDLQNAFYIYRKQLEQWKNDFKFEVIGDDTEAQNNLRKQTVKEAEDNMRSQIQVLKDERDEKLAIVKGNGEAEKNIRNYYAKQIYSIVTGETKSILDNARSTNQTELQNLEDKYEKEKKILRKYGLDLTEFEKAYQKQRAELLYKHDTDAFNNEDSQWKSGASRRRDYEFKLQSNEQLLSAFGLPSEKAVQARLDYIHEETVGFLKEQVRWWKEASENEQYTEEDRNKAYGEFIKAQNALTQENTEYYVKSAQNRMKALDREIENEKKQMQEKQTWQELNFNDNRLKRSGSSNAGQGLWQAFWGGDNPSYKQLQDEMDAQYAILKAGLDAQIALYKKAAYDKNLTDEERAAAKQKWLETEAELDVATAQHTQAVAENYKSMWETTLDAGLSVMDSFADILGSVADTMEAQVQRQLELGQITEEQAEEQRKKIKAIQIAQTIVSTISGAIGAFTQASATIPPPAGQIVGGAAAAAVIAAGIASIAQMRATNKNTNSISNSLPIASPSMAGFEKDYEANMTGNSEVSALRNAIEGADIRAYVVESDITSAQSRSRRRSSESTF